jgi:Cys-rich repeat protein
MISRCLAVALLLSLSVLSSLSCRDARFPVCQEDSDCAKEVGKHCSDLRCVECSADEDCGDGRYCERKLMACRSLGGVQPPSQASSLPSAE